MIIMQTVMQSMCWPVDEIGQIVSGLIKQQDISYISMVQYFTIFISTAIVEMFPVIGIEITHILT